MTYDPASVAPLTLPVLTDGNAGEFPEWHEYVRRIYGSDLRLPLDLSTFTWFYWAAPLRLQSMYLVDWVDTYAEAPYGTPWYACESRHPRETRFALVTTRSTPAIPFTFTPRQPWPLLIGHVAFADWPRGLC